MHFRLPNLSSTGGLPGLILLLLAAPCLAATTPLEEAITKANTHVQKKEYAQAAELYEKAVKIDPKSAKAYLLLGLTYANMGKLDEAAKNSAYSAILDPSYTAHHNLALIYANKGDYERASENYEKALKLNSGSYRAWYEWGLLEASNANFRKAIDHYKKALELNPAFADAHLGMGSALYWTGDKEGAVAQAAALRGLNRKVEAEALEEWIQDKELKKSQAAAKTQTASVQP